MNCPVCGKSNAERLTFCEDCGARLRPRIVPPTPPVGVGAPAAMAALAGAPPQPGVLQPPTPQPGLVSSPVLPAPAPSGPSLASCPRCGAPRGQNLRFCTSCGQPLDARAAATPAQAVAAAPPVDAPIGTPAPHAVPPALLAAAAGLQPPWTPSSSAAAPIAPAPVVDLGTRRPEPEPTRTCSRCRAQSPATAQFCRYCGESLAEAPRAAAAAPAVAAAPAAAPVAPPATDLAVTASFDGSVTTQVAAMAGPVAPKGRIVQIASDGGEGPSHPILDQLDIGRSEGDVVVSDDRALSPRHARIVRRGEKLFVQDLRSVNGVYRRIRRGDSHAEQLRDHDLILLGQQVLRFEIVSAGEEGFGPAMQHGTLVFGTPSGPPLARLAGISTQGLPLDVHHLRKAETVLGRESGDVVFTDDPFLSRCHAAIRIEDVEGSERRFFLVDLESSNGTFLRIRGEVDLEHGDDLRMGQQLFRIDLSDAGSPGGGRGSSPPRPGGGGAEGGRPAGEGGA